MNHTDLATDWLQPINRSKVIVVWEEGRGSKATYAGRAMNAWIDQDGRLWRVPGQIITESHTPPPGMHRAKYVWK